MRRPAPLIFDDRRLGSRVRLTLTGVDQALGDTLWTAVVDEFAAVDDALSGFRPDSAISRLNERAGSGELSRADRRLYAAVALAGRAWRLTGGRFDPRVHDALRRLGQPGVIGPAAARRSSLGSDAPFATRDPCTRSIGLTEPLDLHGIGKGLALRWAWRAIETRLPAGAGGLLDAGGDLVGRAPDADGGAWLIGIEDPAGGPDPVAVLAVAEGAVATSSIRLAHWTDATGQPRHHLIDPATGEPASSGLVAVTVAGPDPAWAEVWTKDLFLAGRATIADRARARGLAAWWITDEGSLEMTPLARLVLRWP